MNCNGTMRVLIAPDKFKGSMSARDAANAIREGLLESSSSIEPSAISCLPIADGGEGTAEAICDALNGKWITCEVSDPLGRTVEAGYALVDGPPKTAVLEMSQASGLWRLGADERDPWRASTFGTGEMIGDALERGAERILLGLGGSATNDGGSGMALALGARFLDAENREITDLPGSLLDVVRVDTARMRALPDFAAACDVSNPLLGGTAPREFMGRRKEFAKT